MKTAIYIENGVTQLVLTPETSWEIDITKRIEADKLVKVYRGTFYTCQGGWVRHGEHQQDESLIIRFEEPIQSKPTL